MYSTDDAAITLLQGRTVGGTTTINWTSCFRTPDRILAHWAQHHGVDTLTAEVLRPHFEAVEARLGVEPWPLDKQNTNNKILWRGAETLGWQRGPIRRNVRNCMDSGYCGFGCPVDAKQAMHLTYIPDALDSGARLYADTRAERIEVAGGKVTAVHATVLDRETRVPTGTNVRVQAKLTVIAGGAINTPLLLLRSGIDPNKRTGKRTFFHPATGVAGIYEDEVRGFYGAPQSVYSHEFVERGPGQLGFFMEVAPTHPMLVAAALGGAPADHREVVGRIGNMSVVGILLVDGLLDSEAGATISLRSGGRPSVLYPLKPVHMEAFEAGVKAAARVHLAAGAKEVRSMHAEPVVVRSEADISSLSKAKWRAHDLSMFTFHIMGGAGMGPDPKRHVVDPRLEHHHVDNLYIVDGSVLPTALGVNPSETIYAIAHWAADHIAAAV